MRRARSCGTLVSRATVVLYERLMIITCPACATRYVVPDSAIGVDGRTVRCANCRHSWFQDGSRLAAEEAGTIRSDANTSMAKSSTIVSASRHDPADENFAGSASMPDADHRTNEGAGPASSLGGERSERPSRPLVYERALVEPAEDEVASSFEHAPPFRPRRNWNRLGMIAAVVFAAIAIAAAATLAGFGLPDWLRMQSGQTFAQVRPDLVIDFPANRQDRRTLPNGAEFFGASGTVTNVGSVARELPLILIVLRDARDRIVYSWEVVPPKRELAPGESITINEAVTDVPKSATVAEIGWKPD